MITRERNRVRESKDVAGRRATKERPIATNGRNAGETIGRWTTRLIHNIVIYRVILEIILNYIATAVNAGITNIEILDSILNHMSNSVLFISDPATLMLIMYTDCQKY